MSLSGEQLAAVRRTGQDVCIVAGPGAGKTHVLVERFRWRVENGVSPLEILGVTFTEKAANELKRRLASDLSDPDLRSQIERAPVSTLDGFCARLLREHAIEAGLDPQFEVLDEFAGYQELHAAATEALDRMLEKKPGQMRALLEAVDFYYPARSLIAVYHAMRVAVLGIRDLASKPVPDCTAAVDELWRALADIERAALRGWNDSQQEAFEAARSWARECLRLPRSPASLELFRALGRFDCNLNRLKRNNPAYDLVRQVKQQLLERARQALVAEYYAPQRALLWEAIDLTDRLYQERKRALNALDFADLEELAIRLLRDNPNVRAQVAGEFQEILMDELQDTNPLQWILIDLIRRPDRFFAVGDINQAIYGFRHADPGVFRAYRNHLASEGKTIDSLTQNHRSREAILRAARAILDGAEGIERRELQAARIFFAKDDPSVEVIAAIGQTTEEAARLEAQWVARRIRELEGALLIQDREAGVRPAELRDMAVLLRNVNALGDFERAFRQAGVPCVVGRGKKFFEAPEVAVLAHCLRVIANPRDEISLAAVLRSPLVGVGDETLLRLKRLGNLADALACLEHVDTSAFHPGDLAALFEFRAELARLRSQCDDLAPDRLLAYIIDRSGYETDLDARARANVRRFLAQLRDWFTRQPRSIARLVRELELLRDFDPDQAAPPEDSLNAVRVLTVHGAKGLEFPVVFLAALHKGVSQDMPPLAFSLQSGLVARWRDPISGRSVKDLPYAVFAEGLRQRELEEENRLLYVGITRAEEHLVLSFAAKRNWAQKVVDRLGIALEPVENRPVVQASPDGSFKIRVLRVNAAPPAAPAAAWVESQPARLAAPVVSGQHDSTASVTSILLFETCPRRYYLARYIGWEPARPQTAFASPRLTEETDEELDASEFGRQVHALLAGQIVPEAALRARELVSRFEASELGRQAASADRAERESDFLMSLEGVVLRGQIDLWFERGGELVLVDYKTDDVDPEEVAARAQAYFVQLRLYALALEKMAGRLPDRAYIYFLRPDLAVPVPLDARYLDAAKCVVQAFSKAQEEMQFPLREGPHCHRCPYYRRLCPAGKTQQG